MREIHKMLKIYESYRILRTYASHILTHGCRISYYCKLYTHSLLKVRRVRRLYTYDELMYKILNIIGWISNCTICIFFVSVFVAK